MHDGDADDDAVSGECVDGVELVGSATEPM